MVRRLIAIITSLKLTIICLVAAMVLIFAGTIAQVHLGIWEAQQRYFQSFFVWWPPEGRGLRIPIFPGGHLIGAVLLINLIAAHAKRFQWAWRKFGIHLTHAGLIIMLAGGLFTDLFAVESHMRLTQGDTRNYSEDPRRMELAVINTSNPEFDQVTAIPEAVLRRGGTIKHKSLPFRLVVRHFYQNSRLHMVSEPGVTLQPIANQGPGAQVVVEAVSRATGVNDRDLVSAAVEIIPAESASLGTWLVSDALGAPQTFSGDGRTWQLVMRPARYYKPYSVTLQKFTHERYVGTDIPKNFASKVTLIDPERSVNRNVLVYMNHPLRYRGETYYQAGFEKDDRTSILQVVRNPSFVAPYIACIVVAVGLLVQFGYHLVGFSRRRGTVAA
ncbi:MAG: ResB protein required for cytochrome C biosynthesis [Verrucomicrobia bacterium]|nr:MAG: ResB protein required for cytochrome C biosynthesis [Verrucomicrobiota bacterium]